MTESTEYLGVESWSIGCDHEVVPGCFWNTGQGKGNGGVDEFRLQQLDLV